MNQLWIEGPCCRIDTLIVDKAHRGKVLRKKLMERAQQYALEQGCKIIEVISGIGEKRRVTLP